MIQRRNVDVTFPLMISQQSLVLLCLATSSNTWSFRSDAIFSCYCNTGKITLKQKIIKIHKILHKKIKLGISMNFYIHEREWEKVSSDPLSLSDCAPKTFSACGGAITGQYYTNPDTKLPFKFYWNYAPRLVVEVLCQSSPILFLF